MSDKTPGELCYEAWWRDRWPLDSPPHYTTYNALSHADQHAWEAAAQAVLTHRPTAIELPRCTYCTAYASDTIHLCEEHYRLKETP